MRRSFFSNFSVVSISSTDKLIVNFGPQHPAAHGVLRLILQLSGECIERVDIHIGLLHRSTEQLISSNHYEKSIPYFDRFDYVSMLSQEHAFCLVIEQLLSNYFYSRDVNTIRIVFDELTRILNHLLAISCHALDVGNMSCLFWCFELREIIMGFYERLSGARMHAAYHSPVNLNHYTVQRNLMIEILMFISSAYAVINEVHNLLTYNNVWNQRLVNIGLLSIQDVSGFSLSGVMASSSGFNQDLRLNNITSYSGYNTLQIRSFVGINGDCYDSYLIRMLEIGESLNILSTLCNRYVVRYLNRDKLGDTNLKNYVGSRLKEVYTNNTLPTLRELSKFTTMEVVINEFLRWHSGLLIPSGVGFVGVESPKGEFGVSLITNTSNHPQKCNISSPSYHHLQFLQNLSSGGFLADLSTLIGTIDIVFGEIDR